MVQSVYLDVLYMYINMSKAGQYMFGSINKEKRSVVVFKAFFWSICPVGYVVRSRDYAKCY